MTCGEIEFLTLTEWCLQLSKRLRFTNFIQVYNRSFILTIENIVTVWLGGKDLKRRTINLAPFNFNWDLFGRVERVSKTARDVWFLESLFYSKFNSSFASVEHFIPENWEFPDVWVVCLSLHQIWSSFTGDWRTRRPAEWRSSGVLWRRQQPTNEMNEDAPINNAGIIEWDFLLDQFFFIH